MRNTFLLLLLLLTSACAPTLGDDDDLANDDDVADDDDSVGDDDDSVGDDDDSVGDDDDDDTPPPYTPSVTFSASFGNCEGACLQSSGIDLDTGIVEYRSEGWDGGLWEQRQGTLWPDALEVLAVELDRVDPSDLEPVYGCPDCADGGARGIAWDLGPVVRTTQYEYGNPPDVLSLLDELMSEIETEIATCNYGDWFSAIPDCDPVPG